MTTKHRPDWLTEPCPPWCAGEHHEQDAPEDRDHYSAYHAIPVIQPRFERGHRSLYVPDHDVVEAEELGIVAVRGVGARETWISIDGENQSLKITLESAHRLHSELGRLLRVATGAEVTTGVSPQEGR